MQFARLRSPSQFATVQLLSSALVVGVFPLQMTRLWHRLLQIVVGYPNSWEDHVDNIATTFYLRGLAQNITMVGFLGKRDSTFRLSVRLLTCPCPSRLAVDIAFWSQFSWFWLTIPERRC